MSPMKPKLTLRDLFWLLLVGAMGCGWALYRYELRRQVDLYSAWFVQYAELDVEWQRATGCSHPSEINEVRRRKWEFSQD